jgi:hypothetical protein
LARLLYRAILFREAEPTGLEVQANHIQQGGVNGLLEVAQAMGDSPEFRSNIAPRYYPRQIVDNIYRVLFNRQADPSGLNTWGSLIRQGRAGQALRGIVASDEFRERHL